VEEALPGRRTVRREGAVIWFAVQEVAAIEDRTMGGGEELRGQRF